MLLLKSLLLASLICFTPNEDAGKETPSERIKAIKEKISGEGTIVEVTIKVKDFEGKVFLANCYFKQGRFVGQIVKKYGEQFILTTASTSYRQDSVKSVKVLKKKP
jgi:hypothetical protein